MRLPGLVVASILLFSLTILGQHASGGGGGANSGGSHGSSGFSSGYSGGYSSAAPSHVGSTSSAVSHTSGSTSSSSGRATSSVAPEKKGLFSFFHRKPEARPSNVSSFWPPIGSKKGEVCTCLGGGSRNAAGQCSFRPQVFACGTGSGWNGYGCAAQYWSNDCRSIAQQLAAQRQQMRGQSDYGQSLRYRLLQQQYQQCLMRYGSYGFGAYSFAALVLDTP